MTIGDWQWAPKGTIENPTIILDEVRDSIKVDGREDGYLYKEGEIANRITIKEENEDDITTDSSGELDEYIDYDSQSNFDEDADGDEDEDDENMEWYYRDSVIGDTFIL
jgi:hypothetical protein